MSSNLRRLRLETSWGPLSIVGGSRAGEGTLILLPQLDNIGGLPGYVADTAGLVLAVIVLAPRIVKALGAQRARAERQAA